MRTGVPPSIASRSVSMRPKLTSRVASEKGVVVGDTVRYELDGHVATITYNRPDALNAINGEMRRDLNAAFARFRDEEDAWVGIVTGAGRAFCVGRRPPRRRGLGGRVSPARSGRSRRRTRSRAAGRSSSR